MSLLEVNKITPQSGTTLTLGDSGDTINFGSGVLPNFENLTVTGDLTVDTNSLKVDSTNNYVGIGTASPNKPLHIETTGETVARIVGGTSSITGLYLGDSGNGSAGQVIYDNNGDYLRFNTSSTERVRITSGGNVGIGTSSPNSKVDIRGTGAVTLNVGSTDGTTARLTLDATNGDASGGDFPLLLSDGSDLTIEANNSTNDAEIILRNNSSDAMRIDSSGNVGIGTSAPAHNVEIVATASGSINDSLQIRNNATATGTGSRIRFINSTDKNSDANGASIASVRNVDDNDLVFETENSEAMRIDHAGNVGIGTTSPSDKLNIVNAGDVGVVIQNTNPSSATFSLLATGAGRVRSSGTLIFDTGGSTERMRIDSSGRVGIGTSSPSYLLQVQDTVNQTPLLYIKNGGTDGCFNALTLESSATADKNIGIQFVNQGAVKGGISYGQSNLINVYNGTTNTNGININSSGSVGIGTSSPAKELHVYASSGESAIQVEGAAGDAGLNLKAVSTSASFVNFGDESSINVGQIYYSHPGNAMQFKTNGSERMRIDSSGKVIIGEEPTDASTNGFSSNGGSQTSSTDSTATRTAYAFRNPNGQVGSITTSGSSTAFNTSSDYRLKENVVEMTGATERLKQLQPKRFNFIADADTTVDGFLAHEVSSIVPEAITGTHNEVDADGNPVYQGIDQSKLVPLLVATIKELEARIEVLENV